MHTPGADGPGGGGGRRPDRARCGYGHNGAGRRGGHGNGDHARGQLQASTLTRKWRIDLINGYVSYPVIARGRVFVMTQTGGLYALDAASGQTEWQAPDSGTVTYDGRGIFALAPGGALT